MTLSTRDILIKGIDTFYFRTCPFITDALKAYYDDEWRVLGVIEHLNQLQRTHLLQLIEAGNEQKVDLIHFPKIIVGNWQNIFHSLFEQYSQDEVSAWFSEVTNARHAAFHYDNVSASRAASALEACERILRVFDQYAASELNALRDELQFGKVYTDQEIADMEWTLGDAYADDGNYYASQGDLQGAIHAYERFLAINGGSGNLREREVLQGLAEAHLALGNIPNAIEYYDRLAIFLGQVVEEDWVVIDAIYWKKGLLYEQIGELDKAINEMEYCVEWELEAEIPEAEDHTAHLEELRARKKKARPNQALRRTGYGAANRKRSAGGGKSRRNSRASSARR